MEKVYINADNKNVGCRMLYGESAGSGTPPTLYIDEAHTTLAYAEDIIDAYPSTRIVVSVNMPTPSSRVAKMFTDVQAVTVIEGSDSISVIVGNQTVIVPYRPQDGETDSGDVSNGDQGSLNAT